MSGFGVVTGRLAAVTVSSCTIDYIGKWTINISNETVGAVYFGSYWDAKSPVGMGWNGTVEGYFDASTGGSTSMQVSVLGNLLSGVKLQDIKFYVGGATSGDFWMPACSTACTVSATDAGAYLGNFKHTVGAKEMGTISFDVYGYKGLMMCCGTSTSITLQSTG